MISCGAQILRAVGGCPTRHGIRTCTRYLPHSLGAYKNALNPEKQRPVDLAFEFQQSEWQAVLPPPLAIGVAWWDCAALFGCRLDRCVCASAVLIVRATMPLRRRRCESCSHSRFRCPQWQSRESPLTSSTLSLSLTTLSKVLRGTQSTQMVPNGTGRAAQLKRRPTPGPEGREQPAGR